MSKKSNITIQDVTRVNEKLIKQSSTHVVPRSGSWCRDSDTGRVVEVVKVSYDSDRGDSIWKRVLSPYVSKKA